MLLRLNSFTALCSVFRSKPPSDSPRGPSRDFILSLSLSLSLTISSPSPFYIDPRIWVTRKKYAPGEFFRSFPLVRRTKERANEQARLNGGGDTDRRRSVIIDRHSYQLSIRPRAHYPSFLLSRCNLDALFALRAGGLAGRLFFDAAEEISFARGNSFVRAATGLSFATMADLYSFIKPARPFVRSNGIRDASGLSTSELGRFTALGRDRAASGSEPTVSTFQLDPPSHPPERGDELRP